MNDEVRTTPETGAATDLSKNLEHVAATESCKILQHDITKLRTLVFVQNKNLLSAETELTQLRKVVDEFARVVGIVNVSNPYQIAQDVLELHGTLPHVVAMKQTQKLTADS